MTRRSPYPRAPPPHEFTWERARSGQRRRRAGSQVRTTRTAQPALLGLLDRLSNTPARVITDLHETLVENDLALALLGKSPAQRGPAASFVYRWFTDPRARERYPQEDHPHHSRVFVAHLQAAAARRGRDAEVAKMVAALRRRSEEFAALWDTHDVAVRRMDHKKIVHPMLGVIALDCYNLLSEDGRQRLLWFTAQPGSPGAEQLKLLSVLGTQELSVTEGMAPERSSASAMTRPRLPGSPSTHRSAPSPGRG